MHKKSAIRQIFCGERGTYNKISLSREYKEAEEKMFDAADAFLEILTQEQKDLFDKTFEYIISENAEYATDHYIEGFKSGVLVGMEITENESNNNY